MRLTRSDDPVVFNERHQVPAIYLWRNSGEAFENNYVISE